MLQRAKKRCRKNVPSDWLTNWSIETNHHTILQPGKIFGFLVFSIPITNFQEDVEVPKIPYPRH